MRAGSRTGVRWFNVYQDERQWESQGDAAGVLTRWVRDHLMRPHPDLGRPGPVCPFVRHGVTRQLIWAGLADGDDISAERMNLIVDDAFELYRGLRQEFPAEARGSTLVTVFPGLTRYDVVDAVHRERNPEVVSQGLMLGQFYPGCTVPGLWDSDFHPLDSPLPMLVLRSMMSTDFPFLAAEADWLYAYFTQLAPDLPRNLRRSIAERMRVSEAEAGEITALRAHSADEHAR
ncbi:DUF6875 domain-containing protein [Nocardia seriolae]|uniref:Heptaprenyl diphosphate synthase n=1 Tax=Nocardia seriolae TaxID=37332 RepID=A0ABC8AY09_9NOCA|nr:hypothetical protein [Nocardia seriolae]APA98900.1 Heptaprenyl diphosphate synthase [Nocardia seriolae]BEK88408.1 hypothetical protein NSERKGN1266_43590 [Nocardia seriolae]BEK95665.1 hypothetical protein NSER024013_35710 [Nocardia seriolae]GAM47495.1 hypothetical protein NS07_v2contig00051-0027 [Nocardia seriolae]GAP29357.1 hypothetical protein NSK11_contig00054-0027 [Nocardia seriolae]